MTDENTTLTWGVPTDQRHHKITRVAQALSDAHIHDWGGQPIPLSELCDADYWRKLAIAALTATEGP
jgi:hypothetical protein